MSNQIEKSDKKNWSEHIQLVKEIYGKGLNQAEWDLYLYTAKKYNFDPLMKEIWAVKYGQHPAMIFVSRDGLLSKAHESGQFNGMKTVCIIETQDGDVKEVDIVPSKASLLGAKCYIYRKDTQYPIEASVRFAEYVGATGSLWASKQETMIKKVAEAHALRRAFDIHGVYIEEEMPTQPQPQQIQEEPKQSQQTQPEKVKTKLSNQPAKFNELPKEKQKQIKENIDKLVQDIAKFTETSTANIVEEFSVSFEDKTYNELKELYRELATRLKRIKEAA